MSGEGILLQVLSTNVTLQSELINLLVKSNYTVKIIHSFNFANTFYDLFRHIFMSPDFHMKTVQVKFEAT